MTAYVTVAVVFAAAGVATAPASAVATSLLLDTAFGVILKVNIM